MGKQGKRVTVTVDIAAQATQFNNIIEQSKKSLSSLSLSPQMDSKKLKEFQSLLDKMQKDAGELQTRLATGLNTSGSFDKAGKDINTLYLQYLGFVKKIEDLEIDINKIFPSSDKYKAKIKEVKKALEDYEAAVKEVSSKEIKVKGHSEYGKQLNKAAAKGNTAEIDKLEKAELKKAHSGSRETYEQLKAMAEQAGVSVRKMIEQIKKEFEDYSSLTPTEKGKRTKERGGKKAYNPEADKKLVDSYEGYLTTRKEIKSAADSSRADATNIANLSAVYTKANEELENLAGPARNDATQGLNQIAQSADQVEHETGQMNGKVREGAEAFDKMSKKAQGLSQLKSYIGYMFSITSVIMKMGQALRNMVTDIKDLDKQLNEISIVTGKSMNELWSGFGKLNSAAQKYGVTTGDVVAVQKLYYQQGRSVAEVNELTGKTLTFAKISGLEFAEATEYMTAALNAFKIEAEDAAKITDVYAALSTEAAVDAQEVAVAMSKVSSLAAASNATLEDTSAYLAKIIETTREAPETAGTALKTVIARFTAVNKLTEEQAELLDEDYNFNNIEKALKTVGIAVKDSTGQMRGFTDILGELGPMWDSLTSNQQHYIATQAAGARQQSRFIALMDDWGRTQELMEVAADSAGTGNKQLELSMDSIASKLNQLKASWQAFYGGLGLQNLAKFFIDFANAILKLLNSLGDLGGWLWILIPLFGSLLKVMINWALRFGKSFASAFTAAYEATRGKDKLKEFGKDLKDAYKQGFAIGKSRAEGEAAGKKAARAKNAAVDVEAAAAASASANIGAAGAGTAGAATGAGLGGFLGKAMALITKAIPYVAIAAAVIAAVLGTLKLDQKLKNKDNEQASKKVASGQNKITEALKKQEAITTSYTRALELQRKGLLRTEEETEEYQKLLSEIQVEYPGIIKKTKDGLLELTEQSDSFIKAQQQVISDNIRSGQKDVLYNSDKAFAMGQYATQEAQDINEELKSTFAILAEKTEDEIAEMGGNVTKKLDPANFTKLAEQGLSYEAMEEALGKGLHNIFSSFDADRYQSLVEEFNRLTNENKLTVDLSESNMFNSPAGKKVLAILNALNTQAGTNIVRELVEANDYSAIVSEQVGQIAQDIQNTKGITISEQVTDLMQDKAVKDTTIDVNDTVESKIEKAYQQKINEFISKNGTTLSYTQYTNTKSILPDTQAQLSYDVNKIDVTTASLEELINFAKSRNEKKGILSENWTVADASSAELLNFLASPDAYNQIIEQQEKDIKNYAELPSEVRSAFESKINEMTKMSQNALNTLSLEDFVNKFSEQIGKVSGTQDEYLIELFREQQEQRNTIINEYKETIGAFTGNDEGIQQALQNISQEMLPVILERTKQMGTKYATEDVKQFTQAYIDYYDTVLSKNEELSAAMSEVDFFNTQSIAKYAAKAKSLFTENSTEYQKFVDLVNNSSSSIDRDFENLEQAIKSATSSIKLLKENYELLQKSFDEGLEVDELGQLLEKYADQLNVSDFTPTASGFKLSQSKATEVSNKIREQEMYNYEMQGYLYQSQYDSYKDFFKTKGIDLTDSNAFSQAVNAGYEKEWNTAQQLAKTIPFYEQMYSLTSMIDYTYESRVKNHEREIDNLETIISLLEKINEYADIDSYMDDLSTKLESYEFEIEFSTNIDNVTGAIKGKAATLGNMINANLAKSDRAKENMGKHRNTLEQDFGKYISFDGNTLLTDTEAMSKWAIEIGNMDDGTEVGKKKQEAEQKRYELLMDTIDAYKDEQKTMNDTAKEAKKLTQEQEKFVQELQQNVVDLEDKFRDLFIKRDEEILESLEERYEAMKQADEDYLNSVRDAVEEERRLRDRDKSASDLEKMERQLELLKMSGGSATAIQDLEQKIADARQDMNDTAVDDMLDSIEKENESRAKSYDDELEYQRAVLEAKKENQIAYNAEIAALMSQDKETIMNTWKALDDEFVSSTDNNKKLLESAMDQMVTKGQSSQKALADPGGVIPTIEDAYKKVKEAIDIDDKAMETFANTIANAGKDGSPQIKGLKNIKDMYFDIYSNIDTAKQYQDQLYTKMQTVVAYYSQNKQTFDANNYTEAGFKKNENIAGGNQSGNVEAKFTTEKGLGWNGEAETWYKINGKWYTHRQITNTNVGVGGEAIIKSGEENKFETDESQEKLLLQRFYSNLYKGGAADKAFTKTNIDAQTERGLGLIPVNSSSSDTIQTYKNANYNDTKNKKWTSSQIADSAWFAGVQNNFVKLRDDGNDSTYYITLSDFMSYFNVGFVEKLRGYSEGGLVDFTGPAMVHGSTSKPEAFLSAKDTVLIAGLRDVLRANTSFGNLSNTPVQKTGDVYYEIHINVDELGEGYSVDDLVDEMEERILQATGKNSVIKIT